MTFEKTATRIWKRLSPEERLAAATRLWERPPEEVVAGALGAIVTARHLRPQVARSLPPDARARALAAILDPGEAVAASLLVALHLGERRPMLVTFLDAAGLPHDDGILKDDGVPPAPIGEKAARAGIRGLAAAFPPQHVQTYLNTLWLQDPERWGALEKAAEGF